MKLETYLDAMCRAYDNRDRWTWDWNVTVAYRKRKMRQYAKFRQRIIDMNKNAALGDLCIGLHDFLYPRQR